MRPRPVGTAPDLHLEHAELDPDLEDRPAVAGADLARDRLARLGSYGQPWIVSSMSRRIARSRPEGRAALPLPPQLYYIRPAPPTPRRAEIIARRATVRRH